VQHTHTHTRNTYTHTQRCLLKGVGHGILDVQIQLMSPAETERGGGDRRGDPIGGCGGWFRVEKEIQLSFAQKWVFSRLHLREWHGLLGPVPVLWAADNAHK
jgi:hypothetical protein